MRISKFIHSCLLVEEGRDKILFDPGKFSFVEDLVKPEQFENLSAVVLTHQHPDHVDDDALRKILDNNASAVVLTNTELKARLKEKGLEAELFETGKRALGKFNLEAFDAPHAQVLGSEPPQNTAYLINDILLHPGDSFAKSLDTKSGTRILALPLMAPWTTELEVAEFARRMKPQQLIPIHDGYAKDFFLEQRYENFHKHFAPQGIQFHRLNKPGDSVNV